MSNFWKSFLCIFACVFLCVVSFFTGYFFRDTVRIKQHEPISSLSSTLQNKSVDVLSDDTELSDFTGDLYLGNLMTMLIGFTSDNPNTYWYPWNNLTLSNPGGAHGAYDWTFYLKVRNNNVSGPTERVVEFYVGSYNNSVEYLKGINEVDVITYNNMKLYKSFNVRFTVDGSPVFGGYSPVSQEGFFRSSYDESKRTRVGFCYSFGSLDGNVVAPSFNFVKYSIGNYTSSNNPFETLGSSDPLYSAISTGRYNWVSWTDDTGFTFSFAIPVYYTDTNTPENRPMWYYSDKTLYYYDGSVDTSDSNYQQGYQTGYQQGYLEGESSGYSSGYTSGYDAGYHLGYDVGFNSTNPYSFSNLLTAVVEAPVNVFISLLDFNIMGYNLLSIVSGLLTLGVIVVIIKLCLGGK